VRKYFLAVGAQHGVTPAFHLSHLLLPPCLLCLALPSLADSFFSLFLHVVVRADQAGVLHELVEL
jgi:hypothetical protein